jgi:hypothetical protein
MGTLLTLVVLAILLYIVFSILRNMQHRELYRRSVVLAPFPEPPIELTGPDGAELLPATTGVYVGTSMAGDWHDQVTVRDIGVQGTATLHLSPTGLVIARPGAESIWIAAESMRGARIGLAIAGKVMTGDGHLVFTWQLGGHLLDTAFRGEDAVYPEWLEAIRQLSQGQVPGEEVG